MFHISICAQIVWFDLTNNLRNHKMPNGEDDYSLKASEKTASPLTNATVEYSPCC